MSIGDKGGVLIWKKAPASGSSARTSIVDKGEVVMWKEAPVSGSSARTSILDKGGVLMVLYLLLLSESWKVGPEKCALY